MGLNAPLAARLPVFIATRAPMRGLPFRIPMSHVVRRRPDARLILLLGALAACGPIATDMYLPSLPSIADSFSASAPIAMLASAPSASCIAPNTAADAPALCG